MDVWPKHTRLIDVEKAWKNIRPWNANWLRHLDRVFGAGTPKEFRNSDLLKKPAIGSHFANIQSLNSMFWAISLFSSFIKMENSWLWVCDNFQKQQKWCEWAFSWIYWPWGCVAKKAIFKGPTCCPAAGICQGILGTFHEHGPGFNIMFVNPTSTCK